MGGYLKQVLATERVHLSDRILKTTCLSIKHYRSIIEEALWISTEAKMLIIQLTNAVCYPMKGMLIHSCVLQLEQGPLVSPKT